MTFSRQEVCFSVFSTSEELKNGLNKHWSTLPTYQKSQVLPSLQQLLNASPTSLNTTQSQSLDSALIQSLHFVDTSKKRISERSRQSTPTEDDNLNDDQTASEANHDYNHVGAKRIRTESSSEDQYTPEDFIAMMENFCSDLIDELTDEISAEDFENTVDEIVAEMPTEELIFKDLVDEFLSNEAFSVALESKTELELGF